MKFLSILVISLIATLSEARRSETIRASELTPTMMSDLVNGKLDDMIVEFRQGDILPLNIVAEGDLVETLGSSNTQILIKRTIWLRAKKDSVEASLDGATFKNFRDLFTGSLEAGSGARQSGGTASSINIGLKVYLKN